MKIRPAFVWLIAIGMFAAAGPTTGPVKVDVGALVDKLGAADPAAREAAEWALVKAYRVQGEEIEAASLQEDLGPQARIELGRIVSMQKPRLAARRRQFAVRAEADRANRETALAQYDKFGKHDPAWDGLAREFLNVYGRVDEDRVPGEPPPSMAELDGLVEKLQYAGCDDPLVLYFTARLYERRPDADGTRIVDEYRRATAAMEASAYPASRKCFAHARYVHAVMANEQWKRYKNWKVTMGKHIQQALAYWPAAMAEPGMTNLAAGDLAQVLEDDWLRVMGKKSGQYGDRAELCDKLMPAWQAAFPKSIGPLVFKGRLYTAYAWDAVGRDPTKAAPPGADAKFDERLAVARQALEAAYAADPTDPRPPADLISVFMGQHRGRNTGRPEMELWWGRAMAADPDNYRACWRKLYYLEPKAYGSPEEMVTFGRECAAGGNWEGRLPFILVDAHVRIAAYAERPDDYFTSSPEIWQDIRSVFDPYLRRYPRSVWDRSNYAYHAAMCGQWDVARQQFELLGDKPDLTSFGTRAAYDEFVRTAREHAATSRPSG